MNIAPERTDLQLRDEIATELSWDLRFDPTEVGVEVDQGIVTLRGTVSSYQKLVAAGEIAAEVPGVKGVANDLVVQPPDQGVRDDTAIARACRWALEWDAEVPDERVECIVRDGAVTLRGSVEHAFERDAAVQAITRLVGVTKVVNEITLERWWRPDAEICGELRAMLAPRAGRVNMIGCRCRDGLVVLDGFALSAEDRLRAEKVAWSTPGVRHVLNRIAVVGS